VGSAGEYAWGGRKRRPEGGARGDLHDQFMPSGTFNFRGQLKSTAYPAIVD
jgi:hypothetical protein